MGIKGIEDAIAIDPALGEPGKQVNALLDGTAPGAIAMRIRAAHRESLALARAARQERLSAIDKAIVALDRKLGRRASLKQVNAAIAPRSLSKFQLSRRRQKLRKA
jgi:hypothetical protein